VIRRRVFHLIKGLGRGGAEVLLEQALRFGDARRFEYAFGYFLPWKELPLGSNLTVEEVERVADAVAASITGYGRRCMGGEG